MGFVGIVWYLIISLRGALLLNMHLNPTDSYEGADQEKEKAPDSRIHIYVHSIFNKEPYIEN